MTGMHGVTSLRFNDKPLPVEFDPKTFVAIGEHVTKFKSYLGNLAKFDVPILATRWGDVSEVEKNLLWQDILENWVIPDDERIRKKILSQIATRWRDFKTTMTRKFVFGSKQNKTPCTKYKISDEAWVQFKESRLTQEWQVCFIIFCSSHTR
ncbi:hypothetical protein V8G54_036220 [Vigna mungo]|uniref:Uncharacterized protein n=1 Tax=Vigna mungo TaxID=3915 RepID=A0AAQ3MGC4_VIGMU